MFVSWSGEVQISIQMRIRCRTLNLQFVKLDRACATLVYMPSHPLSLQSASVPPNKHSTTMAHPFAALFLTLPLVKTLVYFALLVPSKAAFLSSALVLDQRVMHVWVSQSWQVYLGSVYCSGPSRFLSSLAYLQLLWVLPWHTTCTHMHTDTNISLQKGVAGVKPPQGCMHGVCPGT